MTNEQANVEIFWKAYMTLSPQERTSLVEKIMKNDELFEDYLDNQSVLQRIDEPSISLEEYATRRATSTRA